MSCIVESGSHYHWQTGLYHIRLNITIALSTKMWWYTHCTLASCKLYKNKTIISSDKYYFSLLSLKKHPLSSRFWTNMSSFKNFLAMLNINLNACSLWLIHLFFSLLWFTFTQKFLNTLYTVNSNLIKFLFVYFYDLSCLVQPLLCHYLEINDFIGYFLNIH